VWFRVYDRGVRIIGYKEMAHGLRRTGKQKGIGYKVEGQRFQVSASRLIKKAAGII